MLLLWKMPHLQRLLWASLFHLPPSCWDLPAGFLLRAVSKETRTLLLGGNGASLLKTERLRRLCPHCGFFSVAHLCARYSWLFDKHLSSPQHREVPSSKGCVCCSSTVSLGGVWSKSRTGTLSFPAMRGGNYCFFQSGVGLLKITGFFNTEG